MKNLLFINFFSFRVAMNGILGRWPFASNTEKRVADHHRYNTTIRNEQKRFSSMHDTCDACRWKVNRAANHWRYGTHLAGSSWTKGKQITLFLHSHISSNAMLMVDRVATWIVHSVASILSSQFVVFLGLSPWSSYLSLNLNWSVASSPVLHQLHRI